MNLTVHVQVPEKKVQPNHQQLKDASDEVNRRVFHRNISKIMQGGVKGKPKSKRGKPAAQATVPLEQVLPVCSCLPSGR